MTTPAIISSAIFLITLVLIFSEIIHRTIAGMAGATIMVSAGILLDFYNEEQAIAAIDFETIGLLMGMMLLVALLQPTGFFEFIAIKAGRWSQGEPIRLLVLLGAVTTVLSMFLDNVTTIVLIAPVTILICEILNLNPVPFLISEALLSNVGGAGTLVGDPPNILIGTAVPLTFNDFLVHALPVVLVAWLGSLLLLTRLFRYDLVSNPEAAARIRQLDPNRAFDQPSVARRILIILGVAVLFFFVHHLLHVSPAFIAFSAAAVALIWVRPPDVSKTLEHIEWSVLIFFAALFVLVGGLESAGVLSDVARLIAQVRALHPILLGVSMIWAIAVLSAIVDNIPITIALIPVIQGLGTSGVDVTPLWWALVFGAGFGGNGTIIGATANVVVVSLSEKARHPISAVLWSKRGLPVMMLACTIASIMYALFFPFFD